MVWELSVKDSPIVEELSVKEFPTVSEEMRVAITSTNAPIRIGGVTSTGIGDFITTAPMIVAFNAQPSQVPASRTAFSFKLAIGLAVVRAFLGMGMGLFAARLAVHTTIISAKVKETIVSKFRELLRRGWGREGNPYPSFIIIESPRRSVVTQHPPGLLRMWLPPPPRFPYTSHFHLQSCSFFRSKQGKASKFLLLLLLRSTLPQPST